MPLSGVAVAVFILNLPFGYWRANVPKRSAVWFLAVHLPIPFIVLLRLYSGIGFAWFSYPVLIGTFFLGQFAGGRLKLWLVNKGPAWGSSCVFKDAAKAIVLLFCQGARPAGEQASLYGGGDEVKDVEAYQK